MSNLLTQDYYSSSFSTREPKLPGGEVLWLKNLRLKALDQFKQLGFPTDKLETWKYTNLLNNLLKVDFTFEPPAVKPSAIGIQLKKKGFDGEKAHLIVFVNGVYSSELSVIKVLPKGAILQNLASVLSQDAVKTHLGQVAFAEKKAFTAINTAYFTDGLFLQLTAGQVLEAPIHVVYLSANGTQATQSHLRNLLVLGRDSRAQVIEHYWGENVSAYLTNVVTEAVLAQGSSLEHTKIGEEDIKAYHIGTLEVKQEEGSQLTSRIFSLGGALTRNEVDTALIQKKAECFRRSLFIQRKTTC